MNALKDILVDAARYRWLRENLAGFVENCMLSYDDSNNVEICDLTPVAVDIAVDEDIEAGCA